MLFSLVQLFAFFINCSKQSNTRPATDHNPQEYQDSGDTRRTAVHAGVEDQPVWWDALSQLAHEVGRFAREMVLVGNRRTNPRRRFSRGVEGR